MESMRKQLRRNIATLSAERREEKVKELKEERTLGKDIQEAQVYNQHRPKRIVKKTVKEDERTYKLLSRGIPSHFYRNLNKIA